MEISELPKGELGLGIPKNAEERLKKMDQAAESTYVPPAQRSAPGVSWDTLNVGNEHVLETAEPRTWERETARASLLTTREIEVFFLLGAGSSNRSIATKLQITERTVKAHVARIMNKIGVESRLQAGLVAYAYQLTMQDSAPAHLHQDKGQESSHDSEFFSECNQLKCVSGEPNCLASMPSERNSSSAHWGADPVSCGQWTEASSSAY